MIQLRRNIMKLTSVGDKLIAYCSDESWWYREIGKSVIDCGGPWVHLPLSEIPQGPLPIYEIKEKGEDDGKE
jgi:hypothetical protein